MADGAIQDSGQKLQFGRFRLDIRESFTQRVVQQWSRLPREALRFSSLEISATARQGGS